MRINLVDDWQSILRRAWSVKFNIAAAIFGAGEIVVQIVQPTSIRPGVFATVAALVSIAATVARVMAQKEISDGTTK